MSSVLSCMKLVEGASSVTNYDIKGCADIRGGHYLTSTIDNRIIHRKLWCIILGSMVQGLCSVRVAHPWLIYFKITKSSFDVTCSQGWALFEPDRRQ
jgi:hypothetical protein